MPMIKRVFIIFCIMIVLGLVAVFLLNRRNTTSPSAKNTAVANTNAGEGTVEPSVTAPVNAEPDAADRRAVSSRAILFTERFGSYSPETLDLVVSELQPFLTQRGQSEAQTLIQQERARFAVSTDPVGFSTRALTPKIGSYERGRTASVDVGTMRVSQQAGEEPVTTTPTLHLEMLRIDNSWKIDRVRWR